MFLPAVQVDSAISEKNIPQQEMEYPRIMRSPVFVIAAALAVLAPAAAFASSVTPTPVAGGADVVIEWTGECKSVNDDFNANPSPAGGVFVTWPSGSIITLGHPVANPYTLTTPVGAGTAHVFLSYNSADPLNTKVPGCDLTFDIIDALPSPMMSPESMVVGGGLAVALGSVMFVRRRRRAIPAL